MKLLFCFVTTGRTIEEYRIFFAVTIFILFVISSANGQEIGADISFAPDVKTFNLESGNLGQIEGSVNLFTGEVSFPINLISVAGRNGMGMNVSIFYNSDIITQVDTWNAESPTGILGLGWSLSTERIIVDNKMTGTREDDEFYFLNGSSPNKLIYVGEDAETGDWIFELKNFLPWKIRYNNDYERWVIIKEDGTKYIYGDSQINDGTAIEWILKWDNWIGNSSSYVSNVTKQQGLVWNLSRVENLWGDEINYQYNKVERYIRDYTGLKHTEASYLEKISDMLGREIVFAYDYKYGLQHPNGDYEEYVEPNTEHPEPYDDLNKGDAYQERYEQMYLDHIQLFESTDKLHLTVQFDYEIIGFGKKAKRLLKSIIQKNEFGEELPPTTFSYAKTGSRNGALEKIHYPSGAEALYEYSQGIETGYSNRESIITAPDGFAEPQVWVGSEYVVVAWRALDDGEHTSEGKIVSLRVYTWDGVWVEKNVQTFANVETEDKHYKNFRVTLQKDFFGVSHYNEGTNDVHVFLSHKNEESGGWSTKSIYDLEVGDYPPYLISGTNFIAVNEQRDGDINAYVWDGTDWKYQEIDQVANIRHCVAANNYIVSHDEVGHDGYKDVIEFYYLDKEQNWITKVVDPSFYFSSHDKSYWYGSNSFALVMAQTEDEFIYRWDEDYNFISRDNVFGGFEDRTHVYLLNNSMAGIGGKIVGRFNGINWTVMNMTDRQIVSYGKDYNLTVNFASTPAKLEYAYYSPNSDQWHFDYVEEYPSLNNVRSSNSYFSYGDNVYFSYPDFSFSRIYSFGTDFLDQFIEPNILLSQNPIQFDSPREFFIRFVKNGYVCDTPIPIGSQDPRPQYRHEGVGSLFGPSMVGYNIMVTWDSHVVDAENLYFEDATQLKLWKIIDENVQSKVLCYPVESLFINSGHGSLTYDYNYDETTAKYDIENKSAYFNKVTVTKNNDSGSEADYGYTEYYFFNGLSASESSYPFPYCSGSNAASNVQKLKGQQYAVLQYDHLGKQVSSSKWAWKVLKNDVQNSEGVRVNTSYVAQVLQNVTVTDDVANTITNSYDQETGFLVSQETSDSKENEIKKEFSYYKDAYDVSSNNLLLPIIKTITSINNTTVGISVNTWKEWNGIAAPHRIFSWKRTGSADFAYWQAGQQPGDNWQMESEIVQIDDKGNVLEMKDLRGVSNTLVYDHDQTTPIAQITNASCNEVAYSSFENDNTGNWSFSTEEAEYSMLSVTGQKSYLGDIQKGDLPSGRYKLSFWNKNGVVTVSGGSVAKVVTGETLPDGWTYNEYELEISAGAILNLSNSGIIDELRIYPIDAKMSSASNKPLTGVISKCDENNLITHYEYDNFGRPKLVRNGDKGIIQGYDYQYIKQ